MPSLDEAGFMSVHEAASRLGVSVQHLLVWNMVVIQDVDGQEMVASWSVDRQIAKYLPTLSRVFQGEALTHVLATMRPMNDGRDGFTALREGHWREVLAAAQEVRDRFDAVMRDGKPVEMAARLTADNSGSVTLH